MPPGKRRIATVQQIIECSRLLSEHCTKTDDGHADYAEGWDDAKVAETMGGTMRASMVARVRRETVGQIRRPHYPAQGERIDAIESLLAEQESAIADLRRRVTSLEKSVETILSHLNLSETNQTDTGRLALATGRTG